MRTACYLAEKPLRKKKKRKKEKKNPHKKAQLKRTVNHWNLTEIMFK